MVLIDRLSAVARNLHNARHRVQDAVRFLLHRGCSADSEGQKSLMASPSGILRPRPTDGDTSIGLGLGSRLGPALRHMIPVHGI